MALNEFLIIASLLQSLGKGYQRITCIGDVASFLSDLVLNLQDTQPRGLVYHGAVSCVHRLQRDILAQDEVQMIISVLFCQAS